MPVKKELKGILSHKLMLAHISYRAGVEVKEIAKYTQTTEATLRCNIRKFNWSRDEKVNPIIWINSISRLIDLEIMHLLKNENLLDKKTLKDSELMTKNLANLIKIVSQMQDFKMSIKTLQDEQKKELQESDIKNKKLLQKELAEQFKEKLVNLLFNPEIK